MKKIYISKLSYFLNIFIIKKIGADGTVDISPSARFCISEAEIIVALYKGL